MEIHRKNAGNIVVLSFAGDLTMDTYPELKDTFSGLSAGEPECVLLDMSRVAMVGSSAIGALVAFHREMEAAGGRLVLAGLSAMFYQVLELLKLRDFFEIYPAEADAIQAIHSTD